MDAGLTMDAVVAGDAPLADASLAAARIRADAADARGEALEHAHAPGDAPEDSPGGINGEAFRALPDEAPLAMPTQSLRIAPAASARPATSPRGIGTRRLLVIGGATALSVVATYEMYLVLGANDLSSLVVFMLVLFLALFAWIALSFTSALAGFASLLGGGGKRLIAPETVVPTTRTALLMPTYNELPARVTAGLQAILELLRALGAAEAFDIFILSDTVEPEVWIAEEAAFLALRQRTGAPERIFYRRRAQNTARKSGNIADWVTRFGAAYPQFLILDADSVMTGEILLRLVAAMEANPGVGLIQTLPVIAGGTTLFARLQQFAGRVYGPLIAHGIAWWHGAEGNYWGHNAIIRTRAFAEQAGLPELRGRKPFGGHIMSHDFIEAALMRRAGWAIHMVPGLAGSYEESPPSLLDLAVRDRRWCQGNLQHIAVLPARGLAWISRLHLLTGIGSYLTAPLWLLFLLTGILIALRARFVPPDYFPGGRSLFPHWPVRRSGARQVDVRGHHGAAAGTQADGRHRRAAAWPRAAWLRRRRAPAAQRAARDGDLRPDRPGRHDDPVGRRVPHPARAGFRLEHPAACRRQRAFAGDCQPLLAPDRAWSAARRRRLGGVALPGAVDAARGAGRGAGDSPRRDDRNPAGRARAALDGPAAHPGGDRPAARPGPCRGTGRPGGRRTGRGTGDAPAG